MFYEEEIIDGILHWRSVPKGDWIEFTKEGLTYELEKERKRDKRKKIQSFLNNENNQNAPWNFEEDVSLQAEVELFITLIAQNHKRTIGAIKSRIRQKDIISTF
jgi:hypothetical protein